MEWGTTVIVFFGVLLDSSTHTLAIPEEKRVRALNELGLMVTSKKSTVKAIQSLAGLLNFFHRVIVPGRAFTRHMYSKFSGMLSKLKPYHHIRLDGEFKQDCRMWQAFLNSNRRGICRPFIDFDAVLDVRVLDFYTDAAKGHILGV